VGGLGEGVVFGWGVGGGGRFFGALGVVLVCRVSLFRLWVGFAGGGLRLFPTERTVDG